MAPEALPPETLAQKLNELAIPAILVGDGAPVYCEKLQSLTEKPVLLAPAQLCHASAGTVAVLGAKLCEAGKTIPGGSLQLEYLRKPQAEREREERLAAEAGK